MKTEKALELATTLATLRTTHYGIKEFWFDSSKDLGNHDDLIMDSSTEETPFYMCFNELYYEMDAWVQNIIETVGKDLELNIIEVNRGINIIDKWKRHTEALKKLVELSKDKEIADLLYDKYYPYKKCFIDDTNIPLEEYTSNWEKWSEPILKNIKDTIFIKINFDN